MQFCYSCMHPLQHVDSSTCPFCGELLQLTCDTTRYLRPGSVLQQKFIVGKSLGAGGFGNTYIGWSQFLRRRVAIKEYFPKQLSSRAEGNGTVSVSDTISQQKFRAGLHQFLEEARSLASLQEVKGVIQVYNFFEENGTGYIVMEFLEGRDVKTILEHTGNQADYVWCRRVVLSVLYTLREIHKRGILHRDIAPDNIFITTEGVIKLIDFGAAKHATALANMNSDIVLKSGYAPVEQYSKKAAQGAYTDLYATAALFYRMLTGFKPQPSIERMNHDELIAPSELGVSIPEQAEFAIMICLNLKPEYRLQTAQEFMDALDGSDFVPVYERQMLETVGKHTAKLEKASSFRKKLQDIFNWKKITVAVIIITAISSGMVGLFYFRGNDKGKSVQISLKHENLLPSCEGLEEKEAQKKLEGLDIDLSISYRYRKGNKGNKVTEMSPAAGSYVVKGQKVSLIIESAEFVTVPDYTGKGKEDIQRDLKRRLGERYSDTLFSYNYTSQKEQKGKCYAQSSIGKLKLSQIKKFQIQISWGTKKMYETVMPDLTGKTIEQAKRVLRHIGLKTQIKERNPLYDSEYPAGIIAYQSVVRGKRFNTNHEDKAGYSVPKVVYVSISKSNGNREERGTRWDENW